MTPGSSTRRLRSDVPLSQDGALHSGAAVFLCGGGRLIVSITGVSKDRTARARLLRQTGSVCASCGATPYVELHHKVGVIEGGDWSEDNLELLCAGCHQWKHKPKYLWLKRTMKADQEGAFVPTWVREELDRILKNGIPGEEVREWLVGG